MDTKLTRRQFLKLAVGLRGGITPVRYSRQKKPRVWSWSNQNGVSVHKLPDEKA